MATNDSENIKLSKGAIEFLQEQKVAGKAKKFLDVDYIFQIEKAIKNNGGMYNCHLLDSTSSYGGFLLQYESKDGVPGIGDIIHISKIIVAQLPQRNTNVYYCKSVKLIRRSMPLLVDPSKIENLSKKKLNEEYKNTVYNVNQSNKVNNNNQRNNNKRKSLDTYDDSRCSLISQLTTFSNNLLTLYLRCKQKYDVKSGKSASTQKDYTLQTFIFEDTKGDQIQATTFNKAVEVFKDKINEGEVYEIKKCNIQLADRNFNQTKCDYRLVFNESTSVIKVEDNGKFDEGIKINPIPINDIMNMPIGKLVDVFGFILGDSNFNQFTSKNGREIKNRKLVLGDDTLSKIDVTLWGNLANPDDNFSNGDLIAINNVRVRDFNGKKNLNSTDSSEIKRTLSKEMDEKLKKFYNDHQNVLEYSDIAGESISSGNQKPPEFAFIKDIINSYQEEMDNKDRPFFQFSGSINLINHSDRNYYPGCAKCKKKMETEVCTYCSCAEKKMYYTFSFKVRDCSGFMWVDMFGDVAEKFLGLKAEDYQAIVEKGDPEANEELIEIQDKVTYKFFDFFGKVRENEYNMQKRYRFSIYRFQETGGAQQKRSLVKKLGRLLG